MSSGGFHKIDYSSEISPLLGIGVLGYGFMGKIHSNAYSKMPFSFPSAAVQPQLIAMGGRNEEQVRAAARQFGYSGYYTEWEKMVEDSSIDIFDNCTPDNLHAGPTIAAAEKGKHVICEKPLAMSSEDAKAMYRAAEKAGVKHMLCHNYRFIPAVRFARDLIREGRIGRIYNFRGSYLQEVGHDPEIPLEDAWYAAGTKSGVLLGIGCHIIDMARFLVGEIVSVSGIEKTFNTERKRRDGTLEKIEADEGNWALAEFENGAVGTLESSGISTGRKNQHTWEINGAKGSIAFDLEDPNHLLVSFAGEDPRLEGFTAISVTDPKHPNRIPYLPPGHNAGWEYGHVHALRYFLDCVAENKPVEPLGATFLDGYRIQCIMEGIKKSSATGKKIELEFK